MSVLARLVKTREGYIVELTEDMVSSLQLTDGSPVEIFALAEEAEARSRIRYASTEEAMATAQAVMSRHSKAFQELAKGPTGLGPHQPRPYDIKKW